MQGDCKTVWNDCLQLIQAQTSAQSFKTWFKPILPKNLERNTLTIQVPSQFFYEWLEEHYLTLLQQAVHKTLGPQGRLAFSIIVDQGNSRQKPFTIKLPLRSSQHTSARQQAAEQPIHSPFALRQLDETSKASYLNPHYTFDTFVEGACNQLARSAAQAIAKKPGGTAFNPFLVYGGIGLGKTHVVQALGNALKAQWADKFVLYTSTEQFTTQFIEALRSNRLQDFSHFYLQADLLIIDDIQFLAGKEKTQEIFFHIFNHLHQAGKQIVITSDCAPCALKGLQERLLSRFKWGLTADLQRPDFETRVAIIRHKMEADGICLAEELVHCVAQGVTTNIRELEGVFISLLAYASLNKREVDLALAQQVLSHLVKEEVATEVGVDYIQKVVAAHHGLAPADLKSKSRKRELVVARQVAMHFAKQYTNHSLKSIGHYFGGRDHSTVSHAMKAVAAMLSTMPHFKRSFATLQEKIKSKALP